MGELIELQAQMTTLEWQLSEATKAATEARAENERLRTALDTACDRIIPSKEAEIERLRAALEGLVAACEREAWEEPDTDLDLARVALGRTKRAYD